MAENKSTHPDSRDDLKKMGKDIGPTKDLPGMHVNETDAMPQFQEIVTNNTKNLDLNEVAFGTYCNINLYIAAPLEDVYNYAANIYSLEEWTYSLRDLKPEEGKPGLYVGTELLAPNTKIWASVDAYPDAKVVDYPCAWDQGDVLWMRYYMRFVDAQATLGKPGTILMWLNCKHPFYERGHADAPAHITESQNRKDRPWVGDFWPMFKAGHDMEAVNLKLIAEARFGYKLKK